LKSSHVIGIGNLTVLVTNDGERQLAPRDLIDILDPSCVRLDGVGRETDQLDSTLGELRLELGESTELGGADWGVIFWMREEDNPLVTYELVEVDWAVGRLGLEVGCDGTQAEARGRNVSKEQ
jgi:hypothetical protein